MAEGMHKVSASTRGIEPLAWAFCGFVAWQQSEFGCSQVNLFEGKTVSRSRNLQVKVILYYGATLKNAATKCLGFHSPRGKA